MATNNNSKTHDDNDFVVVSEKVVEKVENGENESENSDGKENLIEETLANEESQNVVLCYPTEFYDTPVYLKENDHCLSAGQCGNHICYDCTHYNCRYYSYLHKEYPDADKVTYWRKYKNNHDDFQKTV